MKYLCMLTTVSSFAILAFGLWIPFKALVAQEMLELAWAESQARRMQVRPWPWADTWPVARLVLQETDGGDGSRQSMIVLDGAHGESLAFGPGRVVGDDRNAGPTVIAGHRDTHFSGLEHLETGNTLRLQSRDGQWRTFRISSTRVVDSRYHRISESMLPRNSLLLVTCYPFNGLEANGPLRYLVYAEAIASEPAAVVES